MGWWTTVNGDISFYKETWRKKEDVEDRIADNQKEIEGIKIEIAMLMAGRVEDLIGTRDLEGNEIDIPMALRWKLDDYMDRLEDAMYENWKLGFLLENWDNRQGDFIHVPQEPEIIPDPKFPLYAPPLTTDDMNPGVVIGGNSDISPQAQLTGDLDDRQLKLEFDEPETAPDSRGLGSLSDPMPKRFA